MPLQHLLNLLLLPVISIYPRVRLKKSLRSACLGATQAHQYEHLLCALQICENQMDKFFLQHFRLQIVEDPGFH